MNYVYRTIGKTKDYLIICNFTSKEIIVDLHDVDIVGYTYFYSNSKSRTISSQFSLAAYDAYVFVKTK